MYEVTDRTGELKGEFAFKMLSRNASDTAIARFRNEVSALKRVDHPSIIRIVDFSDEQDETPYYVMPIHKGAESLNRLIERRENPFLGDAMKAVDLVIGILEGMVAWHEAGIVHRDISSGNVLVKPNHKPVVIDFGICRTDDGMGLTLDGEGVGTRGFLSPECEQGASTIPDITMDIYSVGKLLWSAITGERPFSNRSRLGVKTHAAVFAAAASGSSEGAATPANFARIASLKYS